MAKTRWLWPVLVKAFRKNSWLGCLVMALLRPLTNLVSKVGFGFVDDCMPLAVSRCWL